MKVPLTTCLIPRFQTTHTEQLRTTDMSLTETEHKGH